MMFNRNLVWLPLVALCTLLISVPTAVTSDEGMLEIVGAWTSSDTSNGAGALMVVTHIGGRRFHVVNHREGPITTPGVDRDSPDVGTITYLGNREYEYTVVRYRMVADGKIGAVAVITGTVGILEDGTLATSNEYWSVYTPDQDSWGVIFLTLVASDRSPDRRAAASTHCRPAENSQDDRVSEFRSLTVTRSCCWR
ncbi:MAG: hypothetical protein JSV80_07375 [Acidobacteriota bacterium]|nr:MAG: hypothetical protein JSV80_07375 [Acidobacteriota bacterium]